MNKKLGLLTAVAMSAAAFGVDLNRVGSIGKTLTRPTKQPLTEEEQNIKIFNAEKKRLDKALKKKLITQEEYNLKLEESLNKSRSTLDVE